MKSLTLTVPAAGLDLRVVAGHTPTQIVLVIPDDAEVTERKLNVAAIEKIQQEKKEKLISSAPVAPVVTVNGFPPRELTEATVIEILREHGGSVKINDSGWRIYDEVAARLGVTIEARKRLTAGTGEPAWRPEVGFARKNLEQRGVLKPTEESGRGIWALSDAYAKKG